MEKTIQTKSGSIYRIEIKDEYFEKAYIDWEVYSGSKKREVAELFMARLVKYVSIGISRTSRMCFIKESIKEAVTIVPIVENDYPPAFNIVETINKWKEIEIELPKMSARLARNGF